MIDNLLLGFSTALSFQNLGWCLLGTILGTAVGVLPGIGTMATMSMLLPFVYAVHNPIGSLIMLAGIYYGAQYGGSTTAILLNVPGESTAVVTSIDGNVMAQQGRGGSALAIAAVGSFIAGSIATLLVAFLSIPIIDFALEFGPAEYASLMLLGIIAAVLLGNKGFFKGLGVTLIGILLGLVGTDMTTGITRFNFNINEFEDGIPMLIIVIGLFGLAEAIHYTFTKTKHKNFIKITDKFWPTKEDWHRGLPAIFRGTILGSFLGILPGAGPVLGAVSSYALEKQISKYPTEFGNGAIEGVAGPESANNASAQTSFIPVLTLGLPFTPVMSLLIAAIMVNGIIPGPNLMINHPELFWGLIASFWIGNVFLLILNLPLIKIWVKLLSVPWSIISICIVTACIAGAYTIGYSLFYVYALIPITILGLILKYLNCEPAPLIMGFVLGPAIEENLRRSLTISNGNWNIFIDRPYSCSILIGCLLIILTIIYSKIKKT
jgi:putative tricarboxylic transport membrane protein